VINFEKESNVKSYFRNGKRVKGHKRKRVRDLGADAAYRNAAVTGASLGLVSSSLQLSAKNIMRKANEKSKVTFEDIIENPEKLKRFKVELANYPARTEQEVRGKNFLLPRLEKLIKEQDELAQLEKAFNPEETLGKEIKDKITSIENRSDWTPEQKNKAISTLRAKNERPGKLALYDKEVARKAPNVWQYRWRKFRYPQKLEALFPKKLTGRRITGVLAGGAAINAATNILALKGVRELRKAAFRRKMRKLKR
jgi:hypothetical protein